MHNSPADLRRLEREPAALSVSLVRRSDRRQTSYEASTVDLSIGGASVETHLELIPGEWIGIIPKGEFPFAIPGRVVWVKENSSDSFSYVAGVQFLDTPTV